MLRIRPLDEQCRPVVERIVREEWGGPMMATRGRLFDTTGLPGYVAVEEGALCGFLLLRMEREQWEVAAIQADPPGRGTGQALMGQAVRDARSAGVRRLWLITTNDNTYAIRFYQKLGMALVAVHIGAMEESRRLKPGIPALGVDGIPIQHELEFAFDLS